MSSTDQRRRAASRIVVVLFVLTIGATAALLVPVTSGSTSRAASPATVVASELHAWKWNPDHPTADGDFYPDPRVVTVDQTQHLVSQVVRVTWQDFSAELDLELGRSRQLPRARVRVRPRVARRSG